MKTSNKLGKFRIIGGCWRGRKLTIPADNQVRPTSDRLRETLFNWLAADIHQARVLDAFAGAGSLGIEAASRGAQQVILNENNPHVVQQLQQSIALLNTTKLDVVNHDFFCYQADQPFDIIFLDPPFPLQGLARCYHTIMEHQLLNSNGLVYVEQPTDNTLQDFSQWQLLKHKQVANVVGALYTLST